MRNLILRAVAVLAATLAGGALAFSVATGGASHPALATANTSVPLSITIDGNHFVNGSGQTIRLLGVDRPGTEYACEQKLGDSDGDDTAAAAAADAAAIAAWDVNAVRIPLNEDCWLGINGEPSIGTVTAYKQVVEQFVTDLNSDGIYAILDLHWSAPATNVANGQRPMPDDHSVAFWTSVATTFKTNPAVLFDAFNEPYSPAAYYPDAAAYPVSWSCWQAGGCTLPVTINGTDPGSDPQTYTAVGMQPLVTAIRATGASQPILLGGLAYANDLSSWLAYEPTDPDHQLAASFHNYEGEACASVSCWNDQIAPVAAQVPVVTGEFDENIVCPAAADDGFDETFTDWADQAGVSYLAWGWYGKTLACGNYTLVDNSDVPAAPNGTAVHDHLAALAAAQTTSTPTTTTPTNTTTPTTTTQTSITPTATSSTTAGITATPPTPTPAAPTTTIGTTNTGTKNTGPTNTATTNTVPDQPPVPCFVPRLTGDRLTQARRRLTASHCRLGRLNGRRGSRSIVATQRPKPGTRGRNGLSVSLSLKLPRRRPAAARPAHAHQR